MRDLPAVARRGARRVLPRSLLGRFSVLSLVAMVALGIVLGRTLEAQISGRAVGDAARLGSGIARFGIQPQLGENDLHAGLAPETVAALDGLLGAGLRSAGVRTIIVWNRAHRAIYSNQDRLIGTTSRAPALTAALRGTQTAEVVGDSDEGDGKGSEIEVHVPLRFRTGGPPAGAFEIAMDYAPVAAAIAHDTHRLYLLLGLGLLLLYAALFRIVATASRALRRHAAESHHQARHDALTGLPNRTSFFERLGEALAVAGASGEHAAVMLVDLDRFKEVNDTLGHHAGDALLRLAADRLRTSLRDTDALARLGGDEFAILLTRVASVEAAREAAARVTGALEEPFALEGLTIHVEASVGIAVFPDHGEAGEELLQRADVAMYQAKASSAACTLYHAAEDPYSASRLSLAGELRQAIASGELVLHYQPKASIPTGAVDGVEALVRWQHPERGLVPPDEFIPLAERTGLIKPLTRYVLDAALAQAAEWARAGMPLTVAVNLSARNLSEADLPDVIAERLRTHGLAPDRLELEITESSVMDDPVRALTVLRRLQAMGLRLAIDDFGRGYSSLAYLGELPVSELKIDRSFVAEMHTRPSHAFIVRATIDLARNLGMQVVAEGVEDESTWSALDTLGCDLVQGYYLSRPQPPEELTAWLRAPERPSAGATVHRLPVPDSTRRIA